MNNSAPQPWWLYIVQCADGTYYTGIAPNVTKRLAVHNAGKGAKYTAGRKPVTLVYCEKHEDKSLASKREHQIKQLTRLQKKMLIANFTLTPPQQ